jgi:hypothetical protein
MPESQTTRDQAGTRASAPACVAFCYFESISVPDFEIFAAQWLAYARPCQRFAPILADRDA